MQKVNNSVSAQKNHQFDFKLNRKLNKYNKIYLVIIWSLIACVIALIYLYITHLYNYILLINLGSIESNDSDSFANTITVDNNVNHH